MRVGLVQLSVGDDPAANLGPTTELIRQAAGQGAQLVLTPEATNLLSPDRARQAALLRPEADDLTLAALRAGAGHLAAGRFAGAGHGRCGRAVRESQPADRARRPHRRAL